MRKFILFNFTFFTTFCMLSQNNVAIYFAQTSAKFKYTDSQGNPDLNMSSQFRSGFGVNYSKVFKSGIFIKPEFGYKNLGAVSSLNSQKLDWSLNYLDFNLGLGGQKQFGPIIPYGGASAYISYLYKATQFFGNNYYNLLTDKGFKRFDAGINMFGGLKYKFSEVNSFFFELRNSTGLVQLEKNSESGKNQKLYNKAFSFHFGLIFNIYNRKKLRSRSRSNF